MTKADRIFAFIAIEDLTTGNPINVKAISALANRRRFDIFLTIRSLRASE